MSDFIDTIWSQFGVETQEHIEEIELNLVETERSGATPELVGSLFRSFHSLKGLGTAVDMNSFSRLAHRAEDILGVVREGDFPLNSDVISLLLAVLDEIKVLRHGVVASHTNADANPQLLEHLAETFSSMEPHRVSPAVLPPDEQPSPVILQVDPEMLLYFLELSREKMVALSSLLGSHCLEPEARDLSFDTALGKLVSAEIDQLGYAAEVMEFYNLAEALKNVLTAVQEHGQRYNEKLGEIRKRLLELYDQLRYIESLSGNVDAGANALQALMADSMHVNIRQLFATVENHLDALQQAYREGDALAAASSLHATLSALNSHLIFFVPHENCTIILMLIDVFSRAARGELHIFSEIIEMTREEVAAVMDQYFDCSVEGICLKECGDIDLKIQRLNDYIWAYESGSNAGNPVDALRHSMAGLSIGPELIKILSPANARDLMQALEHGEQIYEVKVYLESNEEMAALFLAWIDSSGSRIITNRSVFIDGKNWYEMLMVSPLHRTGIRESLAVFDPYGACLRLKPGGTNPEDGEEQTKPMEENSDLHQPSAFTADTSSNVIRVQGESLDKFINLIGEMVLVQSRLHHIIHDERLNMVIARLKQQTNGDCLDSVALLDLVEEHRRDLLETDHLLHNSIGRLQESAIGLRVVPVEIVFKRLPRVVRDLGRSHGKKIRLEMNGQEVRIDKAMVEILADPLLHMVRNSVDHGIEAPDARTAAGKSVEAVIRVSAVQRSNSIVLEIYDDGAGIDTDKVLLKAVERGLVTEDAGAALPREEILRFVFQPGFSTAAVVTETSGRGVGMDVVMTNVMSMGGTIDVASTPGHGTTFTLRMPLSVAVQNVLIVEVSGHTLALPCRYVAEVVDITADELQTVRGEQGVLLRGAYLALHRLGALLGYQVPPRVRSDRIAVVLSNGLQTIGLEVDRVVRRQELFVKDIHSSVAALPGVGGASILGNGRVVLILDGEDLLRMAARSAESDRQL